MSSLKTIAALVALTLLVGCKGDFKACNDSEAKKTVLKIISENTFKSVGEYLKNALQPIVAEAELIDIKTTDSNDKLGAYNCSANYTVKYDDKQHSTSVTYNLSHLEDSNTTDVRVYLGEVPNLVSNILEYLKGTSNNCPICNQKNVKSESPKLNMNC